MTHRRHNIILATDFYTLISALKKSEKFMERSVFMGVLKIDKKTFRPNLWIFVVKSGK